MDDKSISLGSGELRAPARERFSTKLTFFGHPLLTDRWGIGALFEDMEAEMTDADRQDAYLFLTDPNHVPKPPDPNRLVNRFDEFYPGLKKAVVRAIKEFDARNVPVGHLVFINGKVQAWPPPQYDVLPSDFYPTEMNGMSPGYEHEVTTIKPTLRASAAIAELMAGLEAEFLDRLRKNPFDVLTALRFVGHGCHERNCTTPEDTAIIELAKKYVVPWAASDPQNAAMVRRVLGAHESGTESMLWMLGADFEG